MRFIESTKNIVTVGNSIGVTLGNEIVRMNKKLHDEIGVIVFEPELLEEAVARLGQECDGRYFITVRKDSTAAETEIVYNLSKTAVETKHGHFFAVLGPFDNLRSCVKLKRCIDRDSPDDYENAYYEFATD